MCILGECKTTGTIAYEISLPLAIVRTNLIRLHHLGLVYPIAVATPDGDISRNQCVDYFDELFWDATMHAKEHHYHVEGCYGCKIREMLLMVDAALYE